MTPCLLLILNELNVRCPEKSFQFSVIRQNIRKLEHFENLALVDKD